MEKATADESNFYRKYDYQPLSLLRSIRLIKLSSRRHGTTWKYFTIEDHSIDEPGLRYTAVSYTWGDDRTAVPNRHQCTVDDTKCLGSRSHLGHRLLALDWSNMYRSGESSRERCPNWTNEWDLFPKTNPRTAMKGHEIPSHLLF